MTELRRVLFIGSKRQGLRCLEAVHSQAPHSIAGVLTFDDSRDGRSVLPLFRTFATERGLPLSIAESRLDSERRIAEIRPDLCLVVGWYWLFGPDILRAVPGGFIGIHNSLLPRYRGGSPLVWALINGEAEVGFSLFSMTEGMDDGGIWAQASISVGNEERVGEVLSRLEDESVRVLGDVYPRILRGQARPTPQDESAATFCAQRIPEDGLVRWDNPAETVHNFIRAQSEPYPGAFTYLDGAKLALWRARLSSCVYFGTPGQVARRAPEGVHVICGDHRALILEEVGTEDRRAPAYEILRSVKVRLGHR